MNTRPLKMGKNRDLISEENQQLALMWLRGEISYSDICRAIGKTGSNTYNFFFRAIVAAYQNEKIIIK